MTTFRRTAHGLLIALVMGLTVTLLGAAPSHAARASFNDPQGDMKTGNIGDIVKVSYKAGWYWNKYDIEFRKWDPHWLMLNLDTNPYHRGPEFKVVLDLEQFHRAVTVYRTKYYKPWQIEKQVCHNTYGRWVDRSAVGKFGLACLRRRDGKLPERVRVNVASEVIHYTKPGSAFDYARGKTAFGPWIKVARRP